METAVKRPSIQTCSVHKVARGQRVWSMQVYRKAMQLQAKLRLQETVCPHCMSIARWVFQQQFPDLYT